MTTTNSISSFNDLPLVLNAAQLAGVLNISRANAYNLLHREDFPHAAHRPADAGLPRQARPVDGRAEQRAVRCRP